MFRWILLLLLFMFFSSIGVVFSATEIVACTYLAAGEYYLNGNISGTTNCLYVDSSDVYVNLNGYTISGDGGSSDSGITLGGNYENVTIENGVVNNFGRGIYSNLLGDVVRQFSFKNLILLILTDIMF